MGCIAFGASLIDGVGVDEIHAIMRDGPDERRQKLHGMTKLDRAGVEAELIRAIERYHLDPPRPFNFSDVRFEEFDEGLSVVGVCGGKHE